MDRRALTPAPGGSVDPRDVVGRDGQVNSAFRLLTTGNNLVINDPRRMGKTAFLQRLALMARAPLSVIYVDYEGAATADEFLRRTIDALRSHRGLKDRTLAAVRHVFEGVELEAGPLRVKAEFAARRRDDLLEDLVGRIDRGLAGDELVVLALDELPLAIHNVVTAEGPQAGAALLQSLRRLRGRQGTRLRWILTGSIGFHHVLRLAGTTEGAINDVVAFELGPLDLAGATSLAERLLRGVGTDYHGTALAALVDRSGGIPYLLHCLTHQLRSSVGPVDEAAVELAWHAFLDDRDASKAMTHLLTRMEPYYTPAQRAVAKRILDHLALAAAPTTFDALVEKVGRHPDQSRDEPEMGDVVDLLDSDHYLRRSGDSYEWRYPVLRQIWAHRRRLRP